MRNFLFGFGGAVGGAILGFLAAVVVVFGCTVVAGPSDLGLLLALGAVGVGVGGGAAVGAYLGRGGGNPPKPPDAT
jgi:hypothetical protein